MSKKKNAIWPDNWSHCFKNEDRISGVFERNLLEFSYSYEEACTYYNLTGNRLFRFVLLDCQYYLKANNLYFLCSATLTDKTGFQNTSKHLLKGMMRKEASDVNEFLEKLRDIETKTTPQGTTFYRLEESMINNFTMLMMSFI